MSKIMSKFLELISLLSSFQECLIQRGSCCCPLRTPDTKNERSLLAGMKELLKMPTLSRNSEIAHLELVICSRVASQLVK